MVGAVGLLGAWELEIGVFFWLHFGKGEVATGGYGVLGREVGRW